ncbi:DNA repair protein RecO [Desulfonatronospira sp.]|uniref:DNA repair protein RecO n=1 Tax=Desulfonatronospira sp. TaxID=1962951 RepID=UPI0025BB6F50|nr:DNA repair protein RecO [Desulfonatronospira sp.]
MSFSEQVLVLRTGRFKEYDLWVRFLSPTRGVQTGFAFGGCRSRRRFCGCLDSLNLVLFTIGYSSAKRYLVLQEGTLISGFQGVKNQRNKLGMAVHCLNFLQKICLEGDDSSEIYLLILEVLKVMENHPSVPVFFPLLFKARATFIHGYQPVLNKCSVCCLSVEDMGRGFFDIKNGRVFCSDCIPDSKEVLQADRKSLKFLDSLSTAGPSEWIKWRPEQEVLQDCLKVVEAYVQYHIE